ncbi:MAG: MotA/TolQ/ExbB proton channel family protein [Chthoniobacterales bacterium]|nr:MotA/TolQ/ExbB proton channel family protein [Chthoniobacterales bacterium]
MSRIDFMALIVPILGAVGEEAPSGLIFALTESTWEGKAILLVLFLGSIFSWSVMVTKIRNLRFARVQSDRFSVLFRRSRDPIRIFEQGIVFEGSPLYEIYRAGCEELCFQMLGTNEVEDGLRERLEGAPKITPSQMRAVEAAMERALGEAALRLESLMTILSVAVSGAPFLGLLGTVWGVMDAFSSVATSASASLASLAPGVSGALVTTVLGLLVAIPAMFGYNFLVGTIRSMIVRSENFAAELASAFEHRYVRHGGET